MDNPIIILVIILISTIALFAYFFSNKAVVKRKLKKAERKRLSQFYDGESARVIGHIEFTGSPLIAPLSGRECAYYYIKVEQERSSGKSSSWHTLIEEELAGEFVIRDADNYAIIKGPKLKSYIVQDCKFRSGFLNDASQAIEQYLQSKGVESENMLGFNKTLRYREGILEKNELVAIYGKGTWIKAEDVNLSERYGRILEISSTPEEPVYLSDDPDTTMDTIKKVAEEETPKSYGEADSKFFKKSAKNRYFQKS